MLTRSQIEKLLSYASPKTCVKLTKLLYESEKNNR